MSAKEPAAGYGPEECYDLFASLFPEGFAGKDVLTEIAPEGWLDSPLRFAFHPTREQVHRERVRIHHNLRTWPLRSGNRPEVPEPTMEETRARYKDGPVDIGREVGELVAGCLWELFSHENDVLGREGRVVHIGSWRGGIPGRPTEPP